jgi:hypothetical protein
MNALRAGFTALGAIAAGFLVGTIELGLVELYAFCATIAGVILVCCGAYRAKQTARPLPYVGAFYHYTTAFIIARGLFWNTGVFWPVLDPTHPACVDGFFAKACLVGCIQRGWC